MDAKRHLVPVFLRAKDIALIEDCSLRTAERRLTQDKKELGLSRRQRLSAHDYCKKHKIVVEQLIPRYLKVLILVTTASIAFAFGKMIYNHLYDRYKKNKLIQWNLITPNHLEGDIYDSAGNKQVKVEVDWIGPPPENTKPKQ